MDKQKIKEFVLGQKTLLIAPAGYGKTYTLAECIKNVPDGERQLVLTHTHAGIASIKEKMKILNIPTNRYNIETIMGFAQKYVLSYYVGNDVPKIDEDGYYNFLLKKAIEIFKLESVKRTIQYSYQGLFVDEYQDCTKLQHQMLMVLSDILPIHIMGDPMQGIFDFKDPIVDFNEDLKDFKKINALDIPWRWRKEENNEELGINLKKIREILLSNNKKIKLSEFNSIYYENVKENELYTTKRNKIEELLEEDNLLFIHPISTSIKPRLKMIQSFKNRILLLEAVDNVEFYSLASLIDDWVLEDKALETLVRNFFYDSEIFNKTGLDNWFNKTGFKNKKEDKYKDRVESIKKLIEQTEKKFSYSMLSNILKMISKLPEIKCYRKELFYNICKALDIAEEKNKTVYESMVISRNIRRKMGCKIQGKVIGTTLLTKGLEFDVVAILNAHKFSNYKHFYVAITRASKKLIIFSEKEVLKFDNEV